MCSDWRESEGFHGRMSKSSGSEVWPLELAEFTQLSPHLSSLTTKCLYLKYSSSIREYSRISVSICMLFFMTIT